MRSFLGAAIGVALLFPVPAMARTESFTSREGSASASFQVVDSTGCITTDISVSAFERRTSGGQGSVESPWLSVYVYQFDRCNSVALFQANEGSTNVTVQVDRSLQSATAQGSVELHDVLYGGSFNVDVDLAWKATGALSYHRDHSTSHDPGFQWIRRLTGRWRDAQATGTVAIDGTNWLAGGSEWAQIASGEEHRIIITQR